MSVPTTLKIVNGIPLYRQLEQITVVDSSFVLKETDKITFTEDGTVMQLYYHHSSDEWMTSTRNVIDAKQSKFSAEESFDTLFWDIFPKDLLLNLNKECTYIFVLEHVNNRIVLKHNENSLVFLAKVNTESGVNMKLHSDEDRFGKEVEIYNNNLPGTRVGDIVSCDCPEYSKYRGIIIKRINDDNEKQSYYMYDFPHYTSVKSIRGNTPDILYRYLVLMQHKDYRKMFRLIGAYPELYLEFKKANKKMYQICTDIHNVYICGTSTPRGHVYNKINHLLHVKHGKYAELSDVFSIFYRQHPSFIYKLLKTF